MDAEQTVLNSGGSSAPVRTPYLELPTHPNSAQCRLRYLIMLPLKPVPDLAPKSYLDK